MLISVTALVLDSKVDIGLLFDYSFFCPLFFSLSLLDSMEVGVCAEAYKGEEPLRHINSAFMTFEVLDEAGRPRTLPPIRPEPTVRGQSSRLLIRSNPASQISYSIPY